jgi:hypothetical protein
VLWADVVLGELLYTLHMLRKLTIAGIAALLMTTAAHGADALFCSTDGKCWPYKEQITLPKKFTGEWCFVPDDSKLGRSVFDRYEEDKYCEYGPTTIRPNGSDDDTWDCKYNKIKQSAQGTYTKSLKF